MILHAFPENIAKSVAEGQVLQIVVFSIIFGIALALLSEEKRRPMLTFCESLAGDDVQVHQHRDAVRARSASGRRSPTPSGHMGLGILVNLFKLLATFYVALVVSS